MAKIYDYLLEIRARLSTIESAKSVKIGLEKGIGSKDSPFIRIVPEINQASGKAITSCSTVVNDNMVIQVIYGIDIKGTDLEATYLSFYDLEEQIRTKLTTGKYSVGHVKFIHTVTDEDRLQNIKSAISRFEIVGIR